MSITPNDLGFYKPKTINESATNGGRMSHIPFTDASIGNIFNSVYTDTLQASQAHYRKLFCKVGNDDDTIAASCLIAMLRPANADDEVTFSPGTQDDTQGDLSGTEQQYGCGQLTADITAGATSLLVTTEAGAARPIFADGMKIMISNKASVSSGAGTREYLTLASSGAVSWSGNDATLTLASGQSLQNSYLSADTFVSSVVDAGQVAGESNSYSVTSASGTYDDVASPVSIDAIGGIHENWTLTFTSATSYTLVGDTVGNVGSGDISNNYSPNNPNFSKPYLTIPSLAFGGSFQSGDQITFTTDPFAVPIWLKQHVPAGAAAANSEFIIFMDVS